MRVAAGMLTHRRDHLSRHGKKRAAPGVIVALLLVAVLSACASGNSGRQSGNTSDLWQEIPPSFTGFLLDATADADVADAPTLRPITAFRNEYDDGVLERLVFPNLTGIPNENRLEAYIERTPLGFFNVLSLDSVDRSIPKIDPNDIWLSQIRQQEFPGMSVRVPIQTNRNAYGRFSSTILSNAEQETCILSWQVLDRDRYSLPEGTIRVTSLLRYCHHEATEEQLIALMSEFRYAFTGRDEFFQ